jgi:hypothetical protein
MATDQRRSGKRERKTKGKGSDQRNPSPAIDPARFLFALHDLACGNPRNFRENSPDSLSAIVP